MKELGENKGGPRRNIKIAFVYYSFQPFVKNDYEILSKYFRTRKFVWRGKKDLFKLFNAVKWADLTFSWFAGDYSAVVVLFSRLFGKKSIVTAGGGDVAYIPEINYGQFTLPWYKGMLTKFALKHADVVLPFSNFSKDEILRQVKPKNMQIVYIGIDTYKFKPTGNKKDIVITVGTVNKSNLKRKGIETFVRSAKYLPDIHFVVIGKPQDDSIKYLKSIATSNVEFTGFLTNEELLKWYQRAKVYVQSSIHEGFGCSVAEAMLCECIPVVTNRGALPEVVGNCGFYIPYDDPRATAEAIKKSLRSSENLGEQGRERIKKMFPLKRREKEIIDVIEEMA